MKRKRGYSNEFPTGGSPARRLDIRWVPPGLFQAASRKARREGVSLRVQVLRMLKAWTDEDDAPTPLT